MCLLLELNPVGSRVDKHTTKLSMAKTEEQDTLYSLQPFLPVGSALELRRQEGSSQGIYTYVYRGSFQAFPSECKQDANQASLLGEQRNKKPHATTRWWGIATLSKLLSSQPSPRKIRAPWVYHLRKTPQRESPAHTLI